MIDKAKLLYLYKSIMSGPNTMLKSITIKNFRNIKFLSVVNLKNLNIFIGPNNCGKSTILKSINILAQGSVHQENYTCSCNALTNIWNLKTSAEHPGVNIGRLHFQTQPNDAYMHKNVFDVNYEFNPEFLSNYLNIQLNEYARLAEFVHSMPDHEPKTELLSHISSISSTRIFLKQEANIASSQHLTFLGDLNKCNWFATNIVYIDDLRIFNYKKKSISEYIESKNLDTIEAQKIVDFLKQILDPNLIASRPNPYKLKFKDGFEDSLDSQGSGLRSLICLAVDILSTQAGSVILLDEPEIGLHPLAKQEFLRFLADESKTKQIFVSTHDPTFINPILYNDPDLVNIYLYSPLLKDRETPRFIEVNLIKTQEDPSVFSGFLSHTESLKPIHIYVEGTRDVFALQELLLDYLSKKDRRNHIRMYNKISILHLQGDLWSHLLYTIPKLPFRCLVILDSNKKAAAQDVCKKYSELELIAPRFEFRERKKDGLDAIGKQGICPVFCLKKGDVEDILNDNETVRDNVRKEIFEFFDILLDTFGDSFY